MKKSLIDEISRFTPAKKRKSRFKFSKSVFESAKIGTDTGLSSKTNELSLSTSKKRWNGLFFLVLLITVFLTLIAKAYNLQIIHGEDNLLLSEGNRIRIINIMAERGLIKDTNGEIVVRNKPAFRLVMDTEQCTLNKNCDSILKVFLANIDVELDEERIYEDLVKQRKTIILDSGMTKDDIIPIESRISDYPDFSIQTQPQRDYLFGDAFAHLIGYVGFGDTLYPTIEGKLGIEQFYDTVLSGVDGGEIIQVDSTGRKINVISKKNDSPGRDIELFVDKGLQTLAYDLLKEKVSAGEAKAGAIVAQDPVTGGILAMVSYPAFDPNRISEGLTQKEYEVLSTDPTFPFFNRALSATYPPASTFKMIMASAALSEGVVSPHTIINDPGFIQIGSYIFKNWNPGGHGDVNIWRALQVSNDTYFYTVGGGYGGIGGLGIDRINTWATRFGFGRELGIDIQGESPGFVPNSDYKDWYLGDTYITSIGQGDLLATPLQVNNVTSYFANGGYLVKPRIAKNVDGQDTKRVVLAQDLVSETNYEIVRDGLNMAVEPGGTGYPFFDFPTVYEGLEVAGKTGTAEFGSTENEDTHAWFTVFGPLKDQNGDPNAEIALTVFLEEGGGGADDAAPIARKLFDYWFTKKE